MNIMHLVNALPGVAAQGLIWGIMAIGVYITFRILDVADLTVDGTMATGGAAFIMLTMAGAPVPLAMLGAFLAGVLAGLVTGLFHTACGIPAILAGILTQLARTPSTCGSWDRPTGPSAPDSMTCWWTSRASAP